MAYGLTNKEFDKKKKANLFEFLLVSIVKPATHKAQKLKKKKQYIILSSTCEGIVHKFLTKKRRKKIHI